MILIRNFNHPNTRWRHSTTGHQQSMRFSECIDDNFQSQMTEDVLVGDNLLGLVHINKEKLRGCEDQGPP